MSIVSLGQAGVRTFSGVLSRGPSKLAWSKTTIGIASVMLMPDSADAQPVSNGDDLPQVRVTAPKRQQAKRQATRRAPARTAPAVATAPNDAVVNPVVGDGAGVAGYRTPAQAGISRMPAPLLNTPQTVNVVSQQLMQDQRTTSVQDALRNVPGITFTAGEGGVQGDNVTIRGYTARNDFYRDGIRDPGWYTRDAFSFDRVEVYKGPSSFLFGRGSTGGVINIVSKTPQNRDFYVVEATGNSAAGGRVMTDFNKTYGDVTARLSMLGYDTDVADRDNVHTKRYGFAPSVAWQITDNTKDTLSYVYQNDDNIADRGIPMLPGSYFGTSYRQPAPVPRNTYYGVLTPGQDDVERTEAHSITNKFEHEFAPGLKFTNLTGYSNVERFNRTRPVQLSGLGTATSNLWSAPVGGTRLATAGNPLTTATALNNIWIANTNHFQNQTNNELISNVSDVNAQFATGWLHHNVLVGMEFSKENRDQFRTTFADSYRINVANPNPYVTGVLNPTTAATVSKANARGFYAQDQMKVTEWLELLGGVRYDVFDATSNTYTITRATGAQSGLLSLNSNTDFLSYRAGVVLHPTANSSVYYMRGTSANPPAEFTTITNGQQTLDPVESSVDEIGAKADLLNNKLNVNAAVFRIKKKNDIENQGTNAAPNYVAIGTSQVEGFEIGATGKLTDAWSVSGGYAYLKSRLLDSVTLSNVGHELAMTPKNSFSVFTTYELDSQWTIGGGAFYVDSRFSSVANDARIPDYWRFDAMASYKVDRNLTLQLNIYNLTNEYYYDSAAGAGYAVPGAGRYVSVSARASF
ncbi:catecholate siderophore receptor [Rhodopseudomonas rhenobacensis]|uniref:Catecholate siderophore receptor n=1 Tax=Rhodopseudomonas rhenobacensis TaxID=87461 RepID=A0A7W7Z7P7_9BRAD|nr:TonB-dependent siderophore receptor [Rhodopseudomonas rhenobacensis]MBB5049539.1 catecholate siderophore receptor [Rhodopseudomonas rhenobacensis]